MDKVVIIDYEEKEKAQAAVAADLRAAQLKLDAVERLISVAQGNTGESRVAANFLLAWWNAEACGGFKLMELCHVGYKIAEDMATIFAVLPIWRQYPEALGYREKFEALAEQWRLELRKGQ